MSPQRPHDADNAEADVSRILWQASSGYGDLPDEVGDRLDRVLDSLPAADTLHAGGPASTRETWADRWAERLRPKRIRYAIASAAVAVLVTVGGVATAIQLTTGAADQESGASSDQVLAEDQHDRNDEEGAPGAAETPLETEATQNESGEDEAGVDALGEIATYASGSDYDEGTDLIAVMYELPTSSYMGEVPSELAALAEGGDFWDNCERAIAARYPGLLVAVDFARYDSKPAIMALVSGDDGDIAVALTPACADGVIEPLAEQP
ncbi:hypothetical protein [Glycomyces algeriensis]|uniref:Uncharacterized protein n=1 Tax=Glycomyces algeriensis TaxID=256037 RepID=A0A9W6G5Z2_9ACTN|nr:hypothetical protein [Glycomyces algeriensis]MDA1369093.1 hypothetical protein [Glycomyces algeriensis]MDR7353340.1 hypothetical protein [Glycomyces algeriensis]GLI41036.1 hypothetical protein GALLR39Z86_08860 [Glycomyces algeriensis]